MLIDHRRTGIKMLCKLFLLIVSCNVLMLILHFISSFFFSFLKFMRAKYFVAYKCINYKKVFNCREISCQVGI